MNILLFEDNPGDARLIQEMLREIGDDSHISVTERLAQGLEYLRRHDIDVILLDMNLPDSSGLDTLTGLLARFPHLPVVIMTSIADEELAMQSLRLGAQDYLIKGKANGELLRRALIYAIERKKLNDSLSRQASLLDMAHDAICCWEIGAGILYWNGGSRRLYGFDHAGVLGKDLHSLLQTSGIDIGRLHAILEHDGNWEGELTHIAQNGKRILVESRMVVIKQPGQRPLVLEINHDITERKRAEKALQQLNETLEQRVAERSELAEARALQLQALAVELIEAEERERRRIAHLLHEDLQQILAAARMQLLATCASLPPESVQANVVHLLEESIEKSRRLSHELSPAVLHHSGLVPALQSLTRQMHEQFGLHVELAANAVQPLENSPLKVFIFRAVQELLFNVVKHAGVKNARVGLSGCNGSLVITVSDQGLGFNPGALDSPTVADGFGLLSLRERASYIGGSLVIESDPGRGSRFTLTVPLSLAPVDKLQRPAAGRPPITPAARTGSAAAKCIRVLFADDHKVMRQGLISMIADRPDIQVVGEAANGREALERVRELKPDVVVMDVSMPEMDGVEATRRIKAEMPEVRVIGLSMYDDEQIAQTMRQAGAEAFVSKTASSVELLKAIFGITPQQS